VADERDRLHRTFVALLKRRIRKVLATVAGDAGADKPDGITRWLTTLDHKDIGILYLAFGTAAGLLGALDAMMLRTALVTPGADIWGRETYNALFTTHGLTMLFLFATPVLFGLGNYLLPLLVGADDMAFPRINAMAFWMLVCSGALIRSGLFGELLGLANVHPAAVGWTLYPPLSIQMPNAEVDLLLLGLHLSGVSTIAAGINFVVTVLAERDVSWANLDILTWTFLTTGGLVMFAFPILGSSVLLLLADRNLGTTFFTVDGGGPILFQHLFWFFGHPEVYILVLPPMGVISYVLPRFAGRRLFGFRYVVYSTLGIGALSFGVWAHHMFATGIDPRLQASFMAVTLAIAVPSAVKTFNWIATMWNGQIRLRVPMLFCVAAVFEFVLGGVTGIFLASIPVDLVLHGTYYVVGHFHLVLVGMSVFAAFAACYYWFPLFTRRWYHRGLARLHFWLSALSTTAAFGAMLLLGMDGLPRRTATYPVEFAPVHGVITVCALVLGIAQLIWLLNVCYSAVRGEPVTSDDPWDLRRYDLYTREWTALEPREVDDEE
jgi:cytochrome c oxidase subunit 1